MAYYLIVLGRTKALRHFLEFGGITEDDLYMIGNHADEDFQTIQQILASYPNDGVQIATNSVVLRSANTLAVLQEALYALITKDVELFITCLGPSSFSWDSNSAFRFELAYLFDKQCN